MAMVLVRLLSKSELLKTYIHINLYQPLLYILILTMQNYLNKKESRTKIVKNRKLKMNKVRMIFQSKRWSFKEKSTLYY